MRERKVKNKKLWIFAGLILLVLILDHVFRWSDYLGDTDNLAFLKNMIRDNLAGAIAIYMAVTVIGSVVLALPGVTFAIRCWARCCAPWPPQPGRCWHSWQGDFSCGTA